MDDLKLWNTETREIEPIAPHKGNKVLLYTCGPTVYNFAHIGNFRTYVFEDLLRRTIKYFGMEVEQVMNLTDVEDKTIKGAIETNQPLKDFVAPYIKAFFEDLDTLGIERAEHYPAATDYLPKMLEIIQTLLDKGIAYESPNKSIYFSIKHFPKYGRLSHLKLDELKEGASERVNVDEYNKENAGDFVLWKAYDPERDGHVYWESPFGKGRPGWHIECSAMAMSILGETIDIHVGGVDNMFPHHENEIAQSEGCTGQLFVHHWLHSEHLLVDGKKMSKSLGNFFTLRDLLEKGYTGPQVRLMLVQTHYRTQLNFTFEGLEGAGKTLERLGDFANRLNNITQETGEDISSLIIEAGDEFAGRLAEDLNISAALAALFELVRRVNALCDAEKVSKKDAQKVLRLLKKFDSVLNVIPFESDLSIPQNLLEELEKREAARKEKNWGEADRARDVILAAGYLIEDTPQGPRLKPR